MPSQQKLPDDTTAALQRALTAEHAAVWTYGLVTAFLPAAYQDAINRYITAHRARRDSVERVLRDAGAAPHPAAVAYVPPKPVTDPASAQDVIIAAESDCAQAWRSVLEHGDGARLRRAALDALTDDAVRGTRWRRAAGKSPVAIALPGRSSG